MMRRWRSGYQRRARDVFRHADQASIEAGPTGGGAKCARSKQFLARLQGGSRVPERTTGAPGAYGRGRWRADAAGRR